MADAYVLATNLGGTNLNAQEDGGHLTISGTMPRTTHGVNQVRDRVKEIDHRSSAGGSDSQPHCGPQLTSRRV